MCGIVAATAQRDIVQIILTGLKTLEYRGYDSAGIAVVAEDPPPAHIDLRKCAGKLENLEKRLAEQPLAGHCGIGHTRWATHGEPNTRNAHPHQSGQKIAVVHNGIIENHQALREKLQEAGFSFSSDTDTETLAHLVEFHGQQGKDFVAAAHAAIDELDGAYAVAIINADAPQTLVGARMGSPLVVGLGIGENFLASDVQALLPVTNRFHYLEEGDRVVITPDSVTITAATGQAVQRPVKQAEVSLEALDKGRFRHHMLKEIHEQPEAIRRTLEGRVDKNGLTPWFVDADTEKLLQQVRKIHIVACGTSYHAGLVARYWLEDIARIPTRVEIASEYRYRNPVVEDGTLFLTISQSGETADSLAALRFAKDNGYLATLAVCNVANSSLDRESDITLMTRAGPEIGVASTKALTTQLAVLAMFTLKMAQLNGLSAARQRDLLQQLLQLPGAIEAALWLDPAIAAIAEKIVTRDHALFLGRGRHYPIALEGALKLKEVSYIHAEAYPAGELKHGPLALVDEDMPVIAVCPNDELLEKLKSNIEEVRARGGELYVFVDHSGNHGLDAHSNQLIALEASGEFTSPIAFNVPLQLLAYHVAVLRGTDVDQPRNLAKSVTVE
jgi:glucosamine--fructose-6-phosphate aminotransferase (isomerizing)